MILANRSGANLGSFVSMEMIAHQTDDVFGRQLEREVSSILDKYDSGEYSRARDAAGSMEIKNIEKLISKRLGIKTTFYTDGPIAAIIPLYPNKNSIFLQDVYRGRISDRDQNRIIKEMEKTSGWVDTKKAKVGGIFSSYEHKVFMNFQLFAGLFRTKADMVVAILLHELGHAFHGIEMSNRLATNNQVLANVSQALHADKAYSKKDYIYKELKSINSKVTEEDIDALLSDKQVVPGVKWFDVVIGSVNQQLEDNKYDETSFEQLADGFAARFGYGRQIVEGLESLYRVYPTAETNETIYKFERMSEWVTLIGLGLLLGASIVAGAVGALLLSTMAISMSLFLHNSRVDYKTYDDLKIRYKRVRQQFIARIKEVKLSNKELKEIIDEVHTLDNIISETRVHTPLWTSISNFFFRTGTRAEQTMANQQLTEELVLNDLYLKSSELKVLA